MNHTTDSVITVAVGFVLALGGLAERPESNVPLMVVGVVILVFGATLGVRSRR